MLDTNILIYLIKKKPATVMSRFAQHALADMVISCITVAELEFGAAKSGSSKNKRTMAQWLKFLQQESFDGRAAHLYGQLRASLEAQGTPIGPLDILIAAHALSLDATLVTNNVREFARVPGLRVEDWTLP